MEMKNPPHPGELIEDSLGEIGWTVTAAAEALGVSRQHLHNVMAGRSGVTPELAFKLEGALGSTARVWLAMQNDYDIARLRAQGGGAVPRFQPVRTPQLI